MPSQELKSALILRFLALFTVSCVSISAKSDGIGVNWGTAASHPLPPRKAVELLKANGIDKVKLFDADPAVLESLSGSNIRVTVGIPNYMLRRLNSSLKAAESWVHDNLTRYVSGGPFRVLIDYVAVGDEPFLQTYGDQFYPFLIGAATNIQAALLKANLAQRVKVVAPCSFDAVLSEARFRPDVNRTMIKLLTFLNKHRSPFFITISPFQAYLQSKNKNISLDFSLFRETAHPQNLTHKSYKNSFDLGFNTITSALSNAGFPQTQIVVAQIGWPTDGAPNATPSIAGEFMRGLFNHIKSAKVSSDIYILSLFDEDKRNTTSGSLQRHWGLFTFDGQAKYDINFGGQSSTLLNAEDVEYLSPKWCVVDNNKDLSNATSVAIETCAAADCSDLSFGGSCFNLSWPGNVSYAFNSYYQQHDQAAESCSFGGLGLITTVDPSVGSCRFIVGLRTSFAEMREPKVVCWMLSSVVSIFLWLETGRRW